MVARQLLPLCLVHAVSGLALPAIGFAPAVGSAAVGAMALLGIRKARREVRHSAAPTLD